MHYFWSRILVDIFPKIFYRPISGRISVKVLSTLYFAQHRSFPSINVSLFCGVMIRIKAMRARRRAEPIP